MTAADLGTTYLGMRLRNPLVLSASPISARLDGLRRYEEAGAAAVVIQSLFEEQIERDAMNVHEVLELGVNSTPEAADFFPQLDSYNTGPHAYLEHVAACKTALEIPVIASLNGTTGGGWTHYARLIEEAGADALELNVYSVAADPDVGGEEVERRIVDLVRAVRATVAIPVAVKTGPFFSSFANMARRLVYAGASGLVLFNRFMQPDFDLENLEVVPTLKLSHPDEFRLPLRWIAIVHGRVHASLAATGGIHDRDAVVKALLAGADVTMMASVLLREGPARLAEILGGLQSWLDEHEYESVEQLKGSMSQLGIPDPSAFERAHYMQAIAGYQGPDGH